MVQVTIYLTSGEVMAWNVMTSPRRTGIGQAAGVVMIQNSMRSCLNFNLSDDSVIDMSACPCPLCPKAVFIEMTSKLLMVDKELNSAGVEALLGWRESVMSNLVARDAHDLCNRVACIFWKGT